MKTFWTNLWLMLKMGSNSEDEGDSLQEDGVVTITSGDPLAAARAAAILKLVGHIHFIFTA